jgi:deoxycytidylate deaminase
VTRLENKLVGQGRLLLPYFEGRSRHISFLTIRGTAKSMGINSYTITHPLANKFGHLGDNVHSELAALVHLPRSVNASDCTLYNIRFAMDGSLKMSKPCKYCAKLITAFNVRKCYFTNDEGIFERYF